MSTKRRIQKLSDRQLKNRYADLIDNYHAEGDFTGYDIVEVNNVEEELARRHYFIAQGLDITEKLRKTQRKLWRLRP